MKNFTELPRTEGSEDERWLRRVSPKCWISVLHRRTGFGWTEWETALVTLIEPGSRPKRWESDDRDLVIVGGDHREVLDEMPESELAAWFAWAHDQMPNSFEGLLRTARLVGERAR